MRKILSLFVGVALLTGAGGNAFAQEHPDEKKIDRPEQHPPRVIEKKTVVHEHVTEHNTVVHEDVHRPGPAPVRAVGHWNRGQRFGGNRVVFTDFDRYHVRRPPPGYEWVQDGNELVLISLTDGLISDTFIIAVP